MSTINPTITDEMIEKGARALWDEPGWEQASPEQRQHHREAAERALSAVLPDLLRQAKAEAWEEGARTAWERSTPAVNGATYYWRSAGEPANPYRSDLEQGRKRRSMTDLTPEKRAELRELLDSTGYDGSEPLRDWMMSHLAGRTHAATVDAAVNALPALLDAADERDRLAAQLGRVRELHDRWALAAGFGYGYGNGNDYMEQGDQP